MPGVIFALRNRNESVNVNQLNRLHPYYLVYVGNDGQVILSAHGGEAPARSRPFRCKGCSDPVPEAYRPFNREDS